MDQPSRSAAGGVDIVIDRMLFPSTYGLLETMSPNTSSVRNIGTTGFVASIPAGTLIKGEHALSLRVVSSDGQCYYSSARYSVTID